MKRKFLCGLSLIVLLIDFADATECPEHYARGQAPRITNQKIAAKTTELCYEAFGVMHSGITRTPLWSAEHLMRSNIESAQSMSRQNSFHADPHLVNSDRAELRDYARSKFDRGHLAPNGDMPTRTAQHESFTLANMVPQNPNNNRYIWEGIESAVRRLAKSDGDIYVISGPAFIGEDIQQVGNVLVPTHLYKVVYRPRKNQAAVYFLKNEATKDYDVISVSQLQKTIGIDLLPGVPQRIKDATMDLPVPTPHNDGDIGTSRKNRKNTQTNDNDGYSLNSAVHDAVGKFLKYLMK